MKKHLAVSLLFFNIASFAQHNALNKDTSHRYADSLIAEYETQGLKLYNDSMYYAAIEKYTEAGKLQYLLLKKT